MLSERAEMTEEEKASIFSAPEFLDFVEHSTKIIQRALRTEFSSDTTLITIAHRLQTVMDYDKIVSLCCLPP